MVVTSEKTIFFFQAEDGIRDRNVTGVQTCALPISSSIFKLKLDGTMTPLARPGAVADCDEDLPPNWRAPGFRGLDVASDGKVYRSEERRVGKECRTRWAG